MARILTRFIALGVLLITGSVAVWFYRDQTANDRQIAQLEEEKRMLSRVVERLGEEKRVAEVLVTDQRMVDGVLRSSLLFVEVDRSGNSLPPKRFEVLGEMAHIDAMVIKFEQDFVARGDPLRGHSIALFTRIYGDQQSPAQGTPVDPPGEVPAIYRSADPKVRAFEQQLWKDFWKLAEDRDYREKHGVRGASGQGVWGPFEPDKLYTITLGVNGGLSITPEPLKPIYRELIRGTTAESR